MAARGVRIPRQGGDIGGLLAVPEGSGRSGGVVVIPAVRGLDDFVSHVVERLAGDGFAALAVDIFDHPGVPDNPRERPGAQPDEQILGDLDAARAMLQGLAQVDGDSIFAWGYCIGGRFALLWPTYQSGLAGSVSFHGFPTNEINDKTPTEPTGRLAQLTVPIMAFFGDADVAVPISEVERYKRDIAQTSKGDLVQVTVYEGANHMWTSPMNPDRYIEKYAEDCWRRGVDFMRDRMRARKPAAV